MNAVGRKVRLEVFRRIPAGICGNLTVSCGQRHKNKSCRCTGCGYHIKTLYVPVEEQAVLLKYVLEG